MIHYVSSGGELVVREASALPNRALQTLLKCYGASYQYHVFHRLPDWQLDELMCDRQAHAIVSECDPVRFNKQLEEGVNYSFNIWDLRRTQRCVMSGQKREAIEIDFQTEYDFAIPCLAMPASQADYSAYVAIVPGEILCKIYLGTSIRWYSTPNSLVLRTGKRTIRGCQKS